MLIRKIVIENVRSFLERQELSFDGPISIIIGPNGGGKTNLLDTLVTILRRYLLATRYLEPAPYSPDGTQRWQLQRNPVLDTLVFEPHTQGRGKGQLVEIVIEVTESDIKNMRRIQEDAPEIEEAQSKLFNESPWVGVDRWAIDNIVPGERLTYTWQIGSLQQTDSKKAADFLQYLQLFEFDNASRSELKRDTLQLPMVYLPVHRASEGFQSRIALTTFNDRDQKRQLDATTSRSVATNIVTLAVGRLSKKYRLLLEDENVNAKSAFYNDENLKALSEDLGELGYKWKLVTINPDTNEYDVSLTKQGTEFGVGAASSGEREILTYLFAIYALNVRDAVIVVDEPELHLHPRWQRILFRLFEKLSRTTGNQFVLATHSPTFISPASIQYVARVFAENQCSRIIRLHTPDLPNPKHLFNIVNSQNNERIFFSDRVLLVEGLSDRIFFEKALDRLGRETVGEVLEVISVGGKGLFASYQKLLNACHVACTVVADLDYIEQVGTEEIKKLLVINTSEVKKDVIDNITSMDGKSLVDRIEEAMASGNWDDAQDVWSYIKSRRVRLSPSLDDAQKGVLDNFLTDMRSKGVNILSRGALEAYLPEGYRSKDIEKLISFVDQDDFWDQLPKPQRDEIEQITKSLIGLPESKKAVTVFCNDADLEESSAPVSNLEPVL